MLPFLIEIEGYRARVERDREGVLHGRVIEINAEIVFKARTYRMVETMFSRALAAYFVRCQQNGIDPEKPVVMGY